MRKATEHRIWELAVLVEAQLICSSWAIRDGRVDAAMYHKNRASLLSLEAMATVLDELRQKDVEAASRSVPLFLRSAA